MSCRSLMLYGGAMLMLAGCGGDDEGRDAGESAGRPSTATAAPAPKLDAVLACMKREGLDAEDQSTNSTGPNIGVDYPAGRLLVSFEESAEEAKLRTSVAKTQDPSGSAVQKGTVVITAPDDPAAEVGRPIAERCVDSP